MNVTYPNYLQEIFAGLSATQSLIRWRRIEIHSVHEKGSVVEYDAMDGSGTKSQNGAQLARMRNSEIGECKAKVAKTLLRGLKRQIFTMYGNLVNVSAKAHVLMCLL